MSAAGRSRLLGATRQVTLPPYAKIIERGDEVAGVYLVEAGALRIYYISAEGREGTLYWVDPGQSCILALNCLFSRLAYPAWVETDQTETRVAIMSGELYPRALSRGGLTSALHLRDAYHAAVRAHDATAGDGIVRP
jgi:CRP/FNR family transcriptional regulator, anaerobic regulatory protein